MQRVAVPLDRAPLPVEARCLERFSARLGADERSGGTPRHGYGIFEHYLALWWLDIVDITAVIDVGVRTTDEQHLELAIRLDGQRGAPRSTLRETVESAPVRANSATRSRRGLIATHVVRGATAVVRPVVALLAVYDLLDAADVDDWQLRLYALASEWVEDPRNAESYADDAQTELANCMIAGDLDLFTTLDDASQ